MQNQIPKNWQKVKLGELADVVSGFAFKSSEFTNKGIPVIKIRNIASGTLTLENLEYFAGDINGLDKYKINKGDILVSMTGSHVSQWSSVVGKITRNNKDQVFLMNQRVGKIKPDTAKVDNDFLYYSLHNDETTLNLANRAGGSANQANISPEIIKSLEIIIPELEEQKKIASMISAFDDKIEVNNKIAKTLEAMAQAIFKEWFVKFHFPGHEKAEFVDSEIGKIPKGWTVKTLGGLVRRVPIGKRFDTNTVKVQGAIPVLDQGKSGIIGYHDGNPDIEASENNPVIVFANHTCYQNLIMFPFSAIQNVIPFYPSETHYRNIYWLYLATFGLVKFNDYKGHWPEFASKRVLLPPEDLCEKFGEVVESMFIGQYKLQGENQKLAALRDLLLPKLMRGEIRV